MFNPNRNVVCSSQKWELFSQILSKSTIFGIIFLKGKIIIILLMILLSQRKNNKLKLSIDIFVSITIVPWFSWSIYLSQKKVQVVFMSICITKSCAIGLEILIIFFKKFLDSYFYGENSYTKDFVVCIIINYWNF